MKSIVFILCAFCVYKILFLWAMKDFSFGIVDYCIIAVAYIVSFKLINNSSMKLLGQLSCAVSLVVIEIFFYMVSAKDLNFQAISIGFGFKAIGYFSLLLILNKIIDNESIHS